MITWLHCNETIHTAHCGECQCFSLVTGWRCGLKSKVVDRIVSKDKEDKGRPCSNFQTDSITFNDGAMMPVQEKEPYLMMLSIFFF